MALKTRVEEKAWFETNDIPTQAQYSDVWDSNLNIKDDILTLATEGLFFKNLLVQNQTTQIVESRATLLQVGKNSIGYLSAEADFTVSGAGGLDTGTAAANTWYYFHIITNDDNTLFDGLLSLQVSNPTLPANYTLSRRIGSVRLDAGSLIVPFKQQNNTVLYTGDSSSMSVLFEGVALVKTAIDCSALVPPISQRIYVAWDLEYTDSTVDLWISSYLYPENLALSPPVNVLKVTNHSPLILNFMRCVLWIDTDGTQNIGYDISQAPNDLGGVNLFVLGYIDATI